MSKYDPIQYRIKLADDMFKDHQVMVRGFNSPGGTVNELLFRSPESSNGWMHLQIVRGYCLVVLGDLGDAVYEWHGNPPLTFSWLADLDLHYFRSKCVASEDGRGFEEWDEQSLAGRWERYIEGFEEGDRSALLEWWDDLDDDEKFSRNMFNQAVSRICGRRGLDGDGLYDLGMVPSVRCVMHWRALQLIPERGLPKAVNVQDSLPAKVGYTLPSDGQGSGKESAKSDRPDSEKA